MNKDRQSLDALVSIYLADGGRVLKIPTAISATRDEILEYLKSQQVNVISLPKKNATAEAKHRQGDGDAWRDGKPDITAPVVLGLR